MFFFVSERKAVLTVFARLLEYRVWSFRVFEYGICHGRGRGTGFALAPTRFFAECVAGNIAVTRIQLGTPRFSFLAVNK